MTQQIIEIIQFANEYVIEKQFEIIESVFSKCFQPDWGTRLEIVEVTCSGEEIEIILSIDIETRTIKSAYVQYGYDEFGYNADYKLPLLKAA